MDGQENSNLAGRGEAGRLGAAAHVALALDQALADTDQSTAGADQAASGADQAASERDDADAVRDQRSADRDQASADARHAGVGGAATSDPADGDTVARDSTYASTKAARTASRVGRLATHRGRAGSAEARLGASRARDRNATRRDEAAGRRDLRALQAEGRLGSSDASLSEQLAQARERATQDRAAAASDRLHAANERTEAAIELGQVMTELHSAYLDDLTGAFRRAMGRDALELEIDRARRGDGRFVLAFVDVDGLKAVNDRAGHATGDLVLRTLVATMRSSLRSFDPIVRFGGDEFVCAVAGIGIGDVERRFGEIRRSLYADTGVGISVGLAALAEDETLEQLTVRADDALLEAKRARPA